MPIMRTKQMIMSHPARGPEARLAGVVAVERGLPVAPPACSLVRGAAGMLLGGDGGGRGVNWQCG